jgi:hypothetical protein
MIHYAFIHSLSKAIYLGYIRTNLLKILSYNLSITILIGPIDD